MTECRIERVSGTGSAASISSSARLAEHTTLRVGGPARRFLVADTEAELIRAVTECDDRGESVLVIGGGSNMLVSDAGFDGTAVRVAFTGIVADVSACGGAAVRVKAGENWDSLVGYCVEREWSGVEMLSGIPGLVGATAIQNVGAYGSDVSHSIAFVRTWDRVERAQRTFPLAECGFGYRSSRFKSEPGRYLILEVGFQFRLGSLGAPVTYPELAAHLGVDTGQQVAAAAVRDAVLAVRRSKAMVLDEADHDTWSAGSFFTNPVLSAAQAGNLPRDAPRWPTPDGAVKTSAAWLIEHAGFGKGYGRGPATLSTRHVLALTNRGGASAQQLLELAREVRDGVRDAFGITLVPEVNLVGAAI